MNQLLEQNQKVKTMTANAECVVGKFIGGGGQGEVYKATVGDKDIALKWYFPHQATVKQRKALEVLVQNGAPSGQFLWPMDLVVSEACPGYGYIMPLRDSHYKNVIDLIKRRCEPTFYALATSCMQLAHNFFQLHARGLCYYDISWENVFFDPDTGDILVCDNDNVGIDGQSPINVLGTPFFMAPEIVTGEELPSTHTDLFSLAVLNFIMLMVHHPLDGAKEAKIKCKDEPAMKKLYGTEPVFIFDPHNDTNRPVEGYQDNALIYWPIYPQFIRDLFMQSFTEGIKHPKNGRVRESEWRQAFSRLRDYILFCPHCGMENFYDKDTLQAHGKLNKCWSCKREFNAPPRMRIGKSIIMLNANTKLYPHHIDQERLWDFSQPAAAINQHPQNPDIWGLKNLTSTKWNITHTDGTLTDVEPGKSLKLSNNLKVNFGTAEGQIRS